MRGGSWAFTSLRATRAFHVNTFLMIFFFVWFFFALYLKFFSKFVRFLIPPIYFCYVRSNFFYTIFRETLNVCLMMTGQISRSNYPHFFMSITSHIFEILKKKHCKIIMWEWIKLFKINLEKFYSCKNAKKAVILCLYYIKIYRKLSEYMSFISDDSISSVAVDDNRASFLEYWQTEGTRTPPRQLK